MWHVLKKKQKQKKHACKNKAIPVKNNEYDLSLG